MKNDIRYINLDETNMIVYKLYHLSKDEICLVKGR
jgi:hypothetical protein